MTAHLHRLPSALLGLLALAAVGCGSDPVSGTADTAPTDSAVSDADAEEDVEDAADSGLPECLSPVDCDDGNPCTEGRCNAGECVYVPRIEQCANGVDDDCDGDTDCSDDGCAGLPACAGQCVDVAEDLACGASVAALRATASALRDYACALDTPMPGGDAVLRFVPPADGFAAVRVQATPREYAHLLVLDGDCDAGACTMDHALVDGDTLVTPVVGGRTYYLVVDAVVGGVVDVASVALACSSGEICDNGADDDFDEDVDCADDDCVALGPPCEADEITCDDAIDNDGDGASDCADDDCEDAARCEDAEASCDDAFDNDGDGQTDCEDVDCITADACLVACDSLVTAAGCGDVLAFSATEQAFPTHACGTVATPTPEALVAFTADRATRLRVRAHVDHPQPVVIVREGDCSDAGACLAEWPLDGFHEVLAGELDVDANETLLLAVDGRAEGIEVRDSLAVARLELLCREDEVCGDDVDNDWDGDTDCADAACQALGAPCEASEQTCDDGIDNDGDGQTDCADEACAGGPGCDAACGEPVAYVLCGHSAQDVTGGLNHLGLSGCLEDPTPGGELVYAHAPSHPTLVVFEVSAPDLGDDLVLTVLTEECLASACAAPAPAATPGRLEIELDTGEDAFFVIDSKSGGPVTAASVSLTCLPPGGD